MLGFFLWVLTLTLFSEELGLLEVTLVFPVDSLVSWWPALLGMITVSKGAVTLKSHSQSRGPKDTTCCCGGIFAGLDRETTENDWAQFSFPPLLSMCLAYWNLFLSAAGILSDQSIVKSDQVRLVWLKWTNWYHELLLCESWKVCKRKKKILFLQSFTIYLWLKSYLFSILFVHSFIQGLWGTLCFSGFVLFCSSGGELSHIECILEQVFILNPRREKWTFFSSIWR